LESVKEVFIMRKRPKTLVILLTVLFIFISISNSYAKKDDSNKGKADFVQGEVLVKFKKNTQSDTVQSILDEAGAIIKKKARFVDVHLLSIPSNVPVQKAIEALKRNPNIEYAEPNYIVSVIGEEVSPQLVPNDPRYPEMYGLNNTGQTGGTSDSDIDAPEAWNMQTGSQGVVIGVIDSGLDFIHEDILGSTFPGNLWINSGEIPGNGIDDDVNGYIDDIIGWDFANNDNNPYDDNDHGTHVSGTIGAIGNNGIGTTGVMWNAQIMALKFLDANGFGSTFDAIEAIVYAINNGAKLTNNSWGGGGFSLFLKEAIEASGNAGMLFVTSAGNSGKNTDISPHYPSSYDLDNIISVAATDHNDNKASFSNYGKVSVDNGAPGVSILSTLPGNSYGKFNGTSMATPHVSGVAGLIWSQFPGLTHLEVRALIRERIDLIPGLINKTVSWGRLNAAKALSIPSVETTLTCESSIMPPDNLDMNLNITNNTGTAQDFVYLFYYVLQDGTLIPLIETVVADFPAVQIIDIPLSIPLPGGWPLGKHSVKAIVIQDIPGWVVDSSICDFDVQ
jgi:subtilisin family serine protease